MDPLTCKQQASFFSGDKNWGPRVDELDENIVYYWCNVRTEGQLKNRQSQGLHVSTTATGTTDKFQSKLLGNKFDLASMGHSGPGKIDEKKVKAGFQNDHY